MRGIEPLTPSLPRKYSTPELHRLFTNTQTQGQDPGNPDLNVNLCYHSSRMLVFFHPFTYLAQ